MEIKGICVLVATDDIACQKLVDKMLERCAYRVLHVGKAKDALEAIWKAKEDMNLVLTNIHRLQEKGLEIVDDIQKMFDFQIIRMDPEVEGCVQSKGKEIKVAAYAIKLSSISDINELWEFAKAAEEAEKLEEIKQEGTSSKSVSTAQDGNSSGGGGGGGGGKSTMRSKGDKVKREKQKRKEPEEKSEQEETSAGGDSHPPKKPRMVWSKEMHQKFLEAMDILGKDKAFPKKIVEIMNMPGLTRENVASHLQKFVQERNHMHRALQKYRLCIRKGVDKPAAGSKYGVHLSNNLRGPCYLSNQSLLGGYNASERYSSVVNGMPPFLQNLRANSLPSFTTPPQPPAHLLASSSDPDMLMRLNYINLSPNDTISASSDYLHLTDEQCHGGASSLMQMEPNNVFQIYGDQKQNNNTLLPISSDQSFIGLRLTNNGKSVQFGQSNISMNNDIRDETMFSSQTESLDMLYHSSSELPEYHSLSYIPYTSHHHPQKTFSTFHLGENSTVCPSLLADSTATPQHDDHHLPHLGYYEEPFLNPSTDILGNISTTFASQPPSVDSMYGSILHPEEEMYIPIMETTTGNEISFQDPTTINQQLLQQESPMPYDLNIVKLLKEAGVSSHQLLLDDHFNDTIFHNIN